MKSRFIDKLMDRLEQVDPQSLQAAMLDLVQERGLLETIFHSIQEGIIVIDGKGLLTYANRAAEHLIGFSFEEARGRPVLKYIRDIDWEQILMSGDDEARKLLSQELEINYPEHRFVSFYTVPLSESRLKRGAVVMLRDVTSERENEASVLESERLNAIKLLAAGVAHEIGNPLNALNIHLQLLEREIKSLAEGSTETTVTNEQLEELRELAMIARNEVSRLDLIITQFLRAIRPVQPEFGPISIESVLKETLTLLGQELKNRNISIDIDCPHGLPQVQADSGQIKQAFFNLIKNAFQAMPDGGALRISCSHSDTYLNIAFQDTGPGIAPEDLTRIFEAYHTTKKEGSGLGLMIVQRIIQDHGGQIEVASTENKGSSFTVRLPLAEKRIKLLNK